MKERKCIWSHKLLASNLRENVPLTPATSAPLRSIFYLRARVAIVHFRSKIVGYPLAALISRRFVNSQHCHRLSSAHNLFTCVALAVGRLASLIRYYAGRCSRLRRTAIVGGVSCCVLMSTTKWKDGFSVLQGNPVDLLSHISTRSLSKKSR